MTKEEVLSTSALVLVIGRADHQFNEKQVVRSLVCHQPLFFWVTHIKMDGTQGEKWRPLWGLAGQHTKFVRQIFHYHYAGECKQVWMCASNIYTFGKTLEGMRFQVGICLN